MTKKEKGVFIGNMYGVRSLQTRGRWGSKGTGKDVDNFVDTSRRLKVGSANFGNGIPLQSGVEGNGGWGGWSARGICDSSCCSIETGPGGGSGSKYLGIKKCTERRLKLDLPGTERYGTSTTQWRTFDWQGEMGKGARKRRGRKTRR